MFKWFGTVNFTPATRVAEFAALLRDGRLVASECQHCRNRSFPPRADCERCLSPRFDFVEIRGRGHLHTFTRIVAAPAGFEALAPYTLGVVDLEEGGRALARIGESVAERDIQIGMPLQLVPRILEEGESIRVDYTLEKAGSTWSRAEDVHASRTPERSLT